MSYVVCYLCGEHGDVDMEENRVNIQKAQEWSLKRCGENRMHLCLVEKCISNMPASHDAKFPT